MGHTPMASTRRADDVTATVRVLFSACVALLILGGCGKPSTDEMTAPRAGQHLGDAASPDRPEGSDDEPQAFPTPAVASFVDPPKPRPATPTPSRQPAPSGAAHTQPPHTPSSSITERERNEHKLAEQAQWQAWLAAARESPLVSDRLQALEQWAQRPGEALDPVTYGLVDEDESVRTRAQALYQEQLMREAADIVRVQESVPEVER